MARHTHTKALEPLPPEQLIVAPDPRETTLAAITARILHSPMTLGQVEALSYHVDGLIANIAHRSAMLPR